MLLYHVEKKEKKRHPSVCTPATSKKRKKTATSLHEACLVKLRKKKRAAIGQIRCMHAPRAQRLHAPRGKNVFLIAT